MFFLYFGWVGNLVDCALSLFKVIINFVELFWVNSIVIIIERLKYIFDLYLHLHLSCLFIVVSVAQATSTAQGIVATSVWGSNSSRL